MESSNEDIIKLPKLEENKINYNSEKVKEEITAPQRSRVHQQKERDTTQQFEIENFDQKNCTYLYLGDSECELEYYYCTGCDPESNEKMCEDCYKSCHGGCKKENMEGIKPEKEEKGFVCDCGKNKHMTLTKISPEDISPCLFMQLDETIKNQMIYKCNDEGVTLTLCSICFYECHTRSIEVEKESNKKNTKFKKMSSEEQKSKRCQCRHENHSRMNEFTFDINVEDYSKDFNSIWPIQMLNVLFNAENIFDNLSEYIQKNLEEKKNEVKFYNIVSLLTSIFNSNFKTFYYHPKIISMFPYEIFIEFILKLKPVKEQEFALKMRMVFILLFVHLKKDFQLIKSFTISDFMTSTILERLKHREFLMSSNIYTEAIHQKYKIQVADVSGIDEVIKEESGEAKREIDLKRIVIKIGSLLSKSMLNIDIVKYKKEFCICLKIISFTLKSMIFSVIGLNRLIRSLYKFNEEFLTYIVDETGNHKDELVEELIPIFSYLAKIYFLIAINYNDLVVSQHLKKTEIDPRNKKFVNSSNNSVAQLFKMIIKNCHWVSHYYERLNSDSENKKGSISPKIVKIFNEALKLFCLADNTYYTQLSRIDKLDLKVYYYRIEEINQVNNELEEKTNNGRILPFMESNKEHESLISVESKSHFTYDQELILEFKQKIESIIEEFFTYKNILDVNERLIANLKEYSINSSKAIFKHADEDKKLGLLDVVRDKNIEMSRYDNETIEEINHYTAKMIHLISEHFPFVKNENFSEYIDVYIDTMIFSGVDETISKFLYFFSQTFTDKDNKLIGIEIDEVLAFLSLFTLNKTGIKYFLSGKNIKRIMSLFNLYPTKILRFFFMFFKGLFIYKIEISNHRVLQKIKNTLIDFLKVEIEKRNIENIKKEKDNFIIQLILVIKILTSLEENYEFEEYEEIKKEIKTLIRNYKDLNFFDKENFKKIFYDSEAPGSKSSDDAEFTTKFSGENEKPNLLIIRENLVTSKHNRVPSKASDKINFIDNQTYDANEDIILHNNSIMPNTKMQNNFHYNLGFTNKTINDDIILSNRKNFKTMELYLTNKLYFSFFCLVNKNTFYIFDDEDELDLLKEIYNFIDLDTYRTLLQKKSMLLLKHRRILLDFIRTFYFIDILNRKDIKSKTKFLTTEEYKKLKISQNIKPLHSNRKSQDKEKLFSDDTNVKYEFMLQLQKVIEIYYEEIRNLESTSKSEVGKEIEDFHKYLKRIILAVKSISDLFFLEKEMWNYMTIHFNKLAKEFILKADIMKQILLSIQNERKIGRIIRETGKPLKVQEMEKSDFDPFNKKIIYDMVLETFTDICKTTGMDKEFNLATYLDRFDNIAELNFTPFELIESKDYEYFYEKEVEEKATDPEQIKIEQLRKDFSEQFKNIKNSTFFSVIESVSAETELVDFRILVMDYFIKYINSDTKNHTHNYTYSILCVITKLLFYDTEQTHEKLAFITTKTEYKDFFIKFNEKLKEVFLLNFSNCKNFFNVKRYGEITNLNKLIIQFLQLLSEGFNTTFHGKIFGIIGEEDETTKENNGENNEKQIVEKIGEQFIETIAEHKSFVIIKGVRYEESNFFNNNVQNLIRSFELMNLDYVAEGELPYDNLIVLFTNIADFLIEYIGSSDKNDYLFIHIKMLFNAGMHKILFLNIESEDKTKFIQRKRILCYLKSSFMQLLISYVAKKKEKEYIQYICRKYNPPVLYEQILINFNELIQSMIEKKKVDPEIMNFHPLLFKRTLVNLYVAEEDFRESLQLDLCFKIYTFIKILSDIYGIKSISKHFEDYKSELINDGEAAPEVKTSKKENSKKNSKTVDKNLETGFFSIFAFKVYLFLEKLICKVEISDECVKSFTFFVRPALTFHLTKQTKRGFLANVDRSSQFSKLNTIVEETDYFIFEMACNSKYKKTDYIQKFVEGIDYKNLELINYLFIVIHQILVIIKYYRLPSLSDEEYNLIDTTTDGNIVLGIIILAIIQLSFLFVFLVLWYIYKFPMYFQHHIMAETQKTFIFYNEKDKNNSILKVKSFFEDETIKPMKIISDLNYDISGLKQFRIGLVDSIALNREVNILFFTFILLIVYLIVGSPVIIAITALFIANLSPILYDIFVAVRMRWFQLLIVLVFTFMIIYLFVWITLIWMNQLFVVDGTVAPDVVGSEARAESMCTSSLQCIFFMIDYGLRGDIPAFLPNVSYKQSTGYFYGKFVYSIIFYIAVILVLGNIFLGIIVDTFADLRDKNQLKEEDIKNFCYICGISKDMSLKKKIDFDVHRKEDHKIWNYVYFLSYLYISNANDFNGLENLVWGLLKKKDISWIPSWDEVPPKEIAEDDEIIKNEN